ncbi:MAG: hypothetical protein CVV48_03950 [Spirochaetae bacterium HGW-Spirochaetae-4]|jgi:hypothetical protein|uniref:hypothetical protein n=1 Tax=Pleomorphochaeta sp. DL1XJH-081 TaxID=3409690 RepID=UPI000CB23CE4|nr:MAG: hypothetical protein CVV52_09685 [Spirochaetae bacterium HGW-Spirochaetae-8]PKL22183.1 MAG: hypothetical protein CVV48_03950 [Spirochaetae bacterium HGW-Spirochaetae-4]
MRNIAAAKITVVNKSHVPLSIKQEVGLTVESVLLLQDDYSLYAFPLDEIPFDHLLQDLDSHLLSALAFRFVETGHTGYFDLQNCTLFIQGPSWRFSRFPWLKREPALVTQTYAYMVLVAGKERSVVACDGSEKRECLFCEQFAGEVISVIHRLIFRAAITGDMPEEPYFNPRGAWEEAMKDWQVLLAHDDWEHLFETLCSPDYQKHTMDSTWLSLINESYRADYAMLKEVLRFLYDWVEQVLETEEGITAYCIW